MASATASEWAWKKGKGVQASRDAAAEIPRARDDRLVQPAVRVYGDALAGIIAQVDIARDALEERQEAADPHRCLLLREKFRFSN